MDRRVMTNPVPGVGRDDHRRAYDRVERLADGDVLVVGRRLYARCLECNGLVWLNKPIIGSAHVCA